MTDKEKIREDVSKLIIPESECNGMSLMEKGRQYAYREVLGIIDSTSEEPAAPKVLVDMLNAKTASESLDISQEEHDRICDELIYGKEPELVDVDDLPNKEEEPVSEDTMTIRKEWFEHCKKSWYNEGYIDGKHNRDGQFGEPVSEELEDAAFDYAEACKYEGGEKLLCVEHFKAGAKWQKQQDQSTIELAEDHAMLAGMEKMKEQMMAKAVDGDITFDYYGDGDKTYGCIAHDSFCLEDFGLKDRDKVKVIVIKED